MNYTTNNPYNPYNPSVSVILIDVIWQRKLILTEKIAPQQVIVSVAKDRGDMDSIHGHWVRSALPFSEETKHAALNWKAMFSLL